MNKNLSKKLLNWYYLNRRDLPWRKTNDPYKIWISEIMLQQTQVETVIPYYRHFIERYPSLKDLARAHMDDVLKLWEGLGYYSRAKRLIPCASIVYNDYGGVFPKKLVEMLALPGIGPYTAGAILSIAYNIKAPAVDGNVLRVISRIMVYDGDISKAKTRVFIEKSVMKITPDDVAGFNQALMELGALVCIPKNPYCNKCPVAFYCKAYKINCVTKYPVKQKKKKAPKLKVNVAVIKNGDRYFMFQRESEGLLGGFWAFPYTIEDANLQLEHISNVQENFNITLGGGVKIGEVKHIFTHQTWLMQIYLYQNVPMYTVDFPKCRWVTLKQMKALPITTAMKKIIKQIE